MTHCPQALRKMWPFVAFLMAVGGSIAWTLSLASCSRQIEADHSVVEKLNSAKHVKSSNPAPTQTISLAKQVGLKTAALNAFGMEPRDVAVAKGGDPETVFGLLAHFGFGEIVWVDQWTNFPVKLPPPTHPSGAIPRREAIRAFLAAIEASGGCLIQAGKERYLVAKIVERKKYEVAIQELGWLTGKQPPWVTAERIPAGGAEHGGPANRSQPVGSETNRTSAAAGPGG